MKSINQDTQIENGLFVGAGPPKDGYVNDKAGAVNIPFGENVNQTWETAMKIAQWQD